MAKRDVEFEFRWSLVPRPRYPWNQRRQISQFDLEITPEGLTFRTVRPESEREQPRQQAEAIALALVKAMSYQTGEPLTAVFAAVITHSDGVASVDVGMSVGTAMKTFAGAAKWSVHSATTNETSDDADWRRMLDLTERALRSSQLQDLLQHFSRFTADPEQKLDPLFAMIEAMEKEFAPGIRSGKDRRQRVAAALGLSFDAVNDATNIMNNDEIRTARHTGQKPLSAQRDITPDEFAKCVSVANAIIDSYARRV